MTVSAARRDIADESREYILELRDVISGTLPFIYTQIIVLGSLFGIVMVWDSPSSTLPSLSVGAAQYTHRECVQQAFASRAPPTHDYGDMIYTST